MKTIRTLTANLDGILERSEHGIEACATADTGWGIMTPGDPLPINRSESTEVLGWGDIDGPAAVVGAVRVPLSQL